MTTWIESSGGRERGAAGLVRAWVGVCVAPRRFFQTAISTGDQAPGLTFAIVVTLVHAIPRLLVWSTGPILMRVLVLLLVVVFLTPLVLHLCGAVETLALIGLVPDRAGVSQTIQLLGYAGAPCALSGVSLMALCVGPAWLCAFSPELVALVWVVTAGYGTVLAVLGTAIVHDTSLVRAGAAAALPSVLVFGYGFRGIEGIAQLAGTLV